MEFENPYIVYVKTNSNNYITAINSSAFLSDISDWVEIDSGYGDKYHHAQGNYLPQSIYTDSGVYRYKLINNKPVECSAEEIAAQEAILAASTQPPQSPYITWEELDSAYYEGVDSL